MSIDKVSQLPPSYREAMKLPPDGGRSAPMPVPLTNPYEHDDWVVHADEHELRAALRDLHVGMATPPRISSPGDMRCGSPSSFRSFSPAPANRSFSPAPRSFSPFPRTYSPAQMGQMGQRRSAPDAYAHMPPPTLTAHRTSSPALSINTANTISTVTTRNRSPSAPLPGPGRYSKPPLSPARYTYPHPSYDPTQCSKDTARPLPRPIVQETRGGAYSNWEYTSMFSRSREPERERPMSGARSSVSSFSSSYRGRENSGASGTPSLSPPLSTPPSASSPPTISFSRSPGSPPMAYPYHRPSLVSFPTLPPGARHSTAPGSRGYAPSPIMEEHNGRSDKLAQAEPTRRIPRFACITLADSNRIRGIGLPTELRALVSDSLLQGMRPGIKDFCEIMSGVVEWKIEGHPWQEAGEGPRARRIVMRIIATLSSAGWHLVTCADLSKKDKEKDTLVFREGDAPAERDYFSIGFTDVDKMVIIDPPHSVRAEFLSVVKKWPRGWHDGGEKSRGCFEVRLMGAPWSGACPATSCQFRLLILQLLAAMEGQGYELVASVNLNKHRKSDHSVDVDSWIFASKPL